MSISAADAAQRLDVVVLAGGTAQRLGGVSKPDVVVAGRRMIDWVLDGLEQLPEVARAVVVAPEDVELPDGVRRTLEDPPLGGPVAGIAAGLLKLAQSSEQLSDQAGDHASNQPGDHPTGESAAQNWVGILTCDAPDSPQALPTLLRLAQGNPTVEGACAQAHGRTQYLLGVYDARALREAVAPEGRALRDISVRRAFDGLSLITASDEALSMAAHDLDTWQEVEAWERR